MANRPPRDPSTTEILERLKRRRALRRRLKIGGGVMLAAIFVAAVGWAVASTLRDAGSPVPTVAAATTTISVQPAAPRTTLPPGTTHTLPPRPSTTTEPESDAPPVVTTAPASDAPVPTSTGFVVAIDPGHQRRGDSTPEPIGPGSSTTKARVSSGTTGTVTRVPESEVVLAVGLKLRDALEARGVKVVMTRTTQDVSLSNIERTQIANRAGADLFIRVHADGSTNASIHGIHVLYPASIDGWTDDIAAPSRRAAELAQAELVRATGANDRGLNARTDMTGFNWADVPVIIPEIGFMTNPEEDRLLNDPTYQAKIAVALATAAVRFLEERAG